MLKYKKTKNKNYIYFDTIKSAKKINDFISVLNKISKENNNDIILDFTNMTEQSYTSVHVAIAGIADYYQENKNIKIKFKTNKEDYIVHAKTRKPFNAKKDKDILKSNILDRVIVFSTTEEANFISEEIINKLKYSIECEEGVLVGMSWCINEIMDNVFNHSNAKKGYIMVQLHKRAKKVAISIFDTGQGLFNSLNKSGEYTIKDEFEAIELATKKGVTGNRNLGQGNGLWGLKNIIEDNKGYLSIQTGHVNIIYNCENNTEKRSANLPILDQNNLCTRVDFTIKFNNLINVNKALDHYEPMEKINCEIQDMTDYNGWIDFNVKKEATGGVGTRESGQRMRKYLLNMMRIEKNPILINFIDIDMITSSFADEFIGKFIKEIGFIQFNLKCRIVSANEYVSGVINKAIMLRNNY